MSISDTAINPAELVRDNARSLRDPTTHRVSWTNRVIFYFAPLAVGVAVAAVGLRFKGVGQLLAGAGTLTGVLFGLAVFVFSLRLRVSDDPRFTAGSTTVDLVEKLRANVSYAAGVALALTFWLIAVAAWAGENPLNPIVSGVVAVLMIHLAAVLLLVLKRMKTMFVRLG